MDKFEPLYTICILLTVLGWIAIPVGIVVALTGPNSASPSGLAVGCAMVGAGIPIVLTTGAIRVLIGIYRIARDCRQARSSACGVTNSSLSRHQH